MKWEYLAIEERLDSAKLSELGSQSWELVTVVSPGHFVLHYFFKRMLNA
ncbi:hypothetical protein M0208_05165 [Sphingomonas sp. SUN019]|nr:hypothetical protein [Sphingomonas sp. SUN019]UVO49938.1 hypothetical protein M0208_05165 [Sphingomonas sp. SUN019]